MWRSPTRVLITLALLIGGVITPATLAQALSPDDLVVVYNRNLGASRDLARYYAKRRGVPKDHLVGVKVPWSETMDRRTFNNRLLKPVRKRLAALRAQGRDPAVLLVYGIPLVIANTASNHAAGDAVLERRTQALRDTLAVTLRELDTALERPAPQTTYAAPLPELLRYGRGRLGAGNARLRSLARRSGTAAAVWHLQGLLRRLKGHGDADPAAPLMRHFLGMALGDDTALRHGSGLLGAAAYLITQGHPSPNGETGAAVDSDLAVAVSGRYREAGWLPNPFLPRYDHVSGIDAVRRAMVRVGRLDAPTPDLARRMVDDAIQAEQTGLSGTFYIDARGLVPGRKNSSYGRFDAGLRHLYQTLQHRDTLPVVLDNRPAVLAPGSAPNAALYVGWYSLSRYVPAFTWKPGSVGYHVASGEARRFHQANSQTWCKRMIESGVAATLGPVMEPYLESFPPPERFFALLLSGKLPLLDVYYRTIPHLSWRQVLFGDPLYTPFASGHDTSRK